MAGHAHERSLAVAHHHVIGDPHRDLFTGEGMGDVKACRHALLFHRRELRLDHGAALALFDERRDLRVRLRRVRGERMLGSDRAEGDAHDGVGARGENVEAAITDRRAVVSHDVVSEREAHALAFADPVGLHGLHRIGPPGHAVEVRQELFGVARDGEVVHRDFALLHRRTRTNSVSGDQRIGPVDRVRSAGRVRHGSVVGA